MALGPKQMGEAIIRNLKERTGKSLEEWIAVVQQQRLTKKAEVVEFLKKSHKLGHFQAQKIYEHLSGADAYADPAAFESLIFKQEETKSLYSFIKGRILQIGEDVRIQPCQGYIPFYRDKQFAVLSKAAGKAVAIGLSLPEGFAMKGVDSTKSTKGSARINVQLIVRQEADLSKEVMVGIREAYNHS